MTRRSRWLFLLGLSLPTFLFSVPAAKGEAGSPALQSLAAEETASPRVTGASRITIDARTGKIVTPQPGAALEAEMLVLPAGFESALSTSSRGLVIKPSKGPAGGIMVDLQGRFQNVTTATIGADGKLTLQSVTGGSPQPARVDGEGRR